MEVGKTRILESILDYFQKIVNHIENENVAGVFFETDEQNCLNQGYNSNMLYLILNNYNDENIVERGRKVVEENLKVFPKIIYVPTETNFQKVEIASPMLVREYKFLNIVDTGLIKDVPSYIATRIIEMANDQEDIPMQEIRTAVFKEINEIFEILDLDIKISGISKNAKSIPIFTNSSGDKFNINELSSGEKQLFLRTLAIKMLNPENSIILIDEPELSLHPKWQQRIVDVYRKIGKNNQIIIATHSPHILGSVKKENIMLLDKDDEGKIVVRTGDELYDSYGQPTERILEDIMGLKTTRNQEIFDKLEKIREMVNEDKYETDDFKKEYRDLKEILGTMDEDIMLIDAEIQIRRKGLKNVKNK
ncbi:hypothetical protein HMPREF9015_00971 [Leptotrichia wadei F0279]|uniref:ATPase AAA-type core domain-containing protein n=1 Tax=Leptotrichia wadei (strain F0279) TaxID=888055 RepID=U2REH9_LEPWF|nr:hypothetical protein HMPREF9015_00971 [Leptotrichia wadei F0279]